MKAEIISENLKLAIGVLDIAQSTIKSDNARIKTIKPADAEAPNVALMVAGDRVTIEHKFPINADEEVEFGFPISKFKALATNAPAPTVKISNNANGISVKSGTYASKINIPALEACPPFQEDQPCPFIIRSGVQLAGALKKIKGSIYTDQAGVKQAARKIIDGVMFLGDGKILKLYSTDNNRLAKATLESNLDASFVIPKDAVVATHQLLDLEDNSKVFIGLKTNESTGDTSGFRLSVGNTRLTSTIMAGQPPVSVEEFFTRPLADTIELDFGVLRKTLVRVLAFSSEYSVNLKINEDNSVLVFSSHTEGEAQELIHGAANKGPGRTIKINSNYLQDACAGSTRFILESNDSIVRISHIGCPFNTQHVIAQLRQ